MKYFSIFPSKLPLNFPVESVTKKTPTTTKPGSLSERAISDEQYDSNRWPKYKNRLEELGEIIKNASRNFNGPPIENGPDSIKSKTPEEIINGRMLSSGAVVMGTTQLSNVLGFNYYGFQGKLFEIVDEISKNPTKNENYEITAKQIFNIMKELEVELYREALAGPDTKFKGPVGEELKNYLKEVVEQSKGKASSASKEPNKDALYPEIKPANIAFIMERGDEVIKVGKNNDVSIGVPEDYKKSNPNWSAQLLSTVKTLFPNSKVTLGASGHAWIDYSQDRELKKLVDRSDGEFLETREFISLVQERKTGQKPSSKDEAEHLVKLITEWKAAKAAKDDKQEQKVANKIADMLPDENQPNRKTGMRPMTADGFDKFMESSRNHELLGSLKNSYPVLLVRLANHAIKSGVGPEEQSVKKIIAIVPDESVSFLRPEAQEMQRTQKETPQR